MYLHLERTEWVSFAVNGEVLLLGLGSVGYNAICAGFEVVLLHVNWLELEKSCLL